MNKKPEILFQHFFLICLCSLMSICHAFAQTLNPDELQILRRQSESNRTDASEICIKLGEYYLDAGMQDSAIHFLKLANRLTEVKHKNQFVILLYTALGYSGKGMTDSAENAINRALKTNAKRSNEENALYELTAAALDIDKYQYENALKHLFAAEQISAEIPNPKGNALRMKIYHSIGVVFLRQKEFAKAEQYIQTSIDKKFDTRAWPTVRALQNLAIVYTNTNRINEAQNKLDKALELLETNPNADFRKALYVNLGFLLEKTGKFNQAKKLYLKSLALSDSIQNKYFKARTLNNLASVSISLDQWQDAEQYAKQAVENALPLNIYQDLYYGFGNLMLIETHKSNYKKALEFAHEHYRYADSTSNATTKQKLRSLEAKYDYEKKEKEITALRFKESIMLSEIENRNRLLVISLAATISIFVFLFLAIRSNKQKRLIAEQQNKINEVKMKALESQQQMISLQSMINGQESERTRIARDLHDALGGHFSTMKMYLGTLLYEREDLKTIPLLTKTYELIEQTSEEARRIAHNMMPETLIKLGLIQAVKELCTNNSSPLLNFSFLHYGKDIRFRDSAEITIFRIIQELINNTIKHAEATEAIVQLVNDNDRLSITVEDNGKGYEISTSTNESKIGLVAIRNRVYLLNGKIHSESQIGVGTTVLIDFPIQNLE